MSELKKMTRMGSDARKLAALLQRKAPKGHMLAYINPREAALLKEHGGSGEPHADTGIPSFDDGMDTGGFEGLTQGQVDTAAQQQAQSPTISDVPAQQFSADIQSPYASQMPGGGLPPAPASDQSAAETARLQRQDIAASGGAPQTPTFQPSAAPTTDATGGGGLKDLEAALNKYPSLTKIGAAGLTGLLGAGQARRAQQQGQQATQQMQQLAAPYQQAGQAAQAAAQRGELMPVGQQSLQAAQAQIAQDITRRGGVGTQQAATQIEALRQQLLQQQYDYGLKLSGIGDQIAIGAIKTGIQADQYANQLTQSYFGNMLRSFSSQPGQTTQQPAAGGQ